MAKQPEERKTIQISGTAHKELSGLCENRPIERSMFSVASRLIEWYSRQDEPVQAAIANDTVKGLEWAFADALRRLAEDLDHAGDKLKYTKLIGSTPPDEPAKRPHPQTEQSPGAARPMPETPPVPPSSKKRRG